MGTFFFEEAKEEGIYEWVCVCVLFTITGEEDKRILRQKF